MHIKKYKTKYHEYIFTFYYDPIVVSRVKMIQEKVGWKELSFFRDDYETGWVFSSLVDVLPRLQNAFQGGFNIEVDKDVLQDAKDALKRKNQAETGIAQNTLRTDLKIPTLKSLFPFQVQAVDFVDRCDGKALIADDMGLGKTFSSIGYAAYKGYKRVLVVCPASLKENWKREIKGLLGVNASILTDEEPAEWEILNYEQLGKYSDYLKKQGYELVIVDEAHYVKNKKAQRTKYLFKIIATVKDVIFLSGTPLMNRPLEVYPIFNFISPMKFWDFAMRYCGAVEGSFGWDFSGASNLLELKKKMYWMIRREKKDVLEQLPDKTVNVLTSELTPEGKKEYNSLVEDFRTWLLENDLSTNALYAEALTKANYLKQVLVKHKKIEEIIDDFLENGKKIIVFSQYKNTIERLYEHYSSLSVALTGATRPTDRQHLVDTFQNSDGVRIFFSTIKAGGVGITLTAADTVLFTDLSWTPADHHQAEDRAYRIGQKNNVNVYYLLTPETIEEKIWKMLRRKEKMVNSILAGDENVRKVHIKSIFKNL